LPGDRGIGIGDAEKGRSMSDNPQNLKARLVEKTLSLGAVRARVASRDMLEGPPSADTDYVLPGARSVLSFAVPLGTDWIEDYFAKKTSRVFADVMYDRYQLIGAIGGELVSLLEGAGFEAVSPQPNGVYRPGVSHGGFMVPDFSHRYAALASGVGTLGYSGNVMVEGYWSTVFLGSVVTDADLPVDEPLQENLCDDCRICTTACALGFMDPKQKQTSVLGSREHTCSKKHNHGRCRLVCAGLVGMSRKGKWSTCSRASSSRQE
jgi:epoxyqueuosine reductase QueG